MDASAWTEQPSVALMKFIFLLSLLFYSYLCGYIYLKSLDIDSNRCLFIHVPPICEEYTVDTISDGILNVIKKCVEQLLTKCECSTEWTEYLLQFDFIYFIFRENFESIKMWSKNIVSNDDGMN